MAAKTKHMLYTAEGYAALVDELDYLKNIKRQEVKEDLARARSFGDLSENAEYDEARNEQAKVESRITELESIITNARVVDEAEIDADTVSVGSIVRVYDKSFDEELEYCIVGSNEANPLLCKISDQSPVGSALIGSRTDDEVTIDVPNGQMKLKILSVTRATSKN